MRTPASLPELTRVAAEQGVIFAGAVGGGYVFPGFLAAYDAMASLCKLLELLATQEPRKLSEIVRELPKPTLIHRQVPCPWALKGTVMRPQRAFRRRQRRPARRDQDLRRARLGQVLPDRTSRSCTSTPRERPKKESEELESELRELVAEVVEGEEIAAPH